MQDGSMLSRPINGLYVAYIQQYIKGIEGFLKHIRGAVCCVTPGTGQQELSM
jgi:hypothetical protein